MDLVSAVKPRDVRTVSAWDREADVVVVGLGSAGVWATPSAPVSRGTP